MLALPRMARIRQKFPSPAVNDVTATVLKELQKLRLANAVKPGHEVAITAGSRGIANIGLITRTVVDAFRDLGAVPFIVPAMGSHGGGTPEGQLGVLADYGITPQQMGCEIRATMETVILSTTPEGIPVHFDAEAARADHVFICNRIKPHTMFVGPVESGLHKMMMIGLSNHTGAQMYHRAILNYPFLQIIRAAAKVVIEKAKVCGGLAILENAKDETALIQAVVPEEFFERESALLVQAREWLPRLPFPDADLLIVDQIGKNISGTGMDTNVVGRKFNDHAATPEDLARIKRIFVRGLTKETHGNASGIGIAEFTNARTVAGIDWAKTNLNCLTANHPTGGMVPMVFPTDRAAIEAAIQTIGMTEPPAARVIQISDTLHLEEVLVSEAFEGELSNRADLERITPYEPMSFLSDGNLEDLSAR